jgi:flavin reductase (DIM6/NTAB) family NADH-FMN oxidoreductase RutF
LPQFDQRAFRDVMGRFCTGVVLVTGVHDGEPVGFAAQSFVSLSLEPPLVGVCPATTSSSWPRIRASGHFCINVLGAGQKPLCDAFARSGGDKYAGVSWTPAPSGSPRIEGTLAWIDCALEAEHEAGDHTIAVGRVTSLEATTGAPEPLLFFTGAYGRYAPLA